MALTLGNTDCVGVDKHAHTLIVTAVAKSHSLCRHLSLSLRKKTGGGGGGVGSKGGGSGVTQPSEPQKLHHYQQHQPTSRSHRILTPSKSAGYSEDTGGHGASTSNGNQLQFKSEHGSSGHSQDMVSPRLMLTQD